MQKIKKLLSDAFGDNINYLDSIESIGFLQKEDSFVVYDGHEPVSVLFTKKYPLNLDSHMVWADYVYYVATEEKHRNRGLMRNLFKESLNDLKSRGGDCAVIIPAEQKLFKFYSELGFETAFYVRKKVYLPCGSGRNIYIPSSEEAKKFYPRYYDIYGTRNNTLFKTEKLFYMSVDENLLDSESYSVLSGGEDLAFAKLGDIIEIREYIGNDPDGFAKSVADKYQKKTVMSMMTDGRDFPVGMILRYNGGNDVPPLFLDNMLN